MRRRREERRVPSALGGRGIEGDRLHRESESGLHIGSPLLPRI